MLLQFHYANSINCSNLCVNLCAHHTIVYLYVYLIKNRVFIATTVNNRQGKKHAVIHLRIVMGSLISVHFIWQYTYLVNMNVISFNSVSGCVWVAFIIIVYTPVRLLFLHFFCQTLSISILLTNELDCVVS